MTTTVLLLIEMMVCADAFLAATQLGESPRPEIREDGVPTGRIAHTTTAKGVTIHFVDHDVHVDLVSI